VTNKWQSPRRRRRRRRRSILPSQNARARVQRLTLPSQL